MGAAFAASSWAVFQGGSTAAIPDCVDWLAGVTASARESTRGVCDNRQRRGPARRLPPECKRRRTESAWIACDDNPCGLPGECRHGGATIQCLNRGSPGNMPQGRFPGSPKTGIPRTGRLRPFRGFQSSLNPIANTGLGRIPVHKLRFARLDLPAALIEELLVPFLDWHLRLVAAKVIPKGFHRQELLLHSHPVDWQRADFHAIIFPRTNPGSS